VFSSIGPTEIIVILIVALIVFGPKRLPEIGRSIGRSIREFRRASSEIREELEQGLSDEEGAEPSDTPGRAGPPGAGAAPLGTP
jgi:sec-independent protein translocase protein TatA